MTDVFVSIKFFLRKIYYWVFRKKKKNDGFDAIAFPLITRVFAKTISSELISIQPFGITSEPDNVYSRKVLTEKTKSDNYISIYSPSSSMIIYLDYRYGNINSDTETILTENIRQNLFEPVKYTQII
jgi:hypothetical protein